MANRSESRTGNLRQIAQNLRSNNKVQVELGVSGLSFFLFPIGPTIIGTLNMVNAGIEARNVRNNKPGASKIRAGFYTAAGLFEFGLQAGGQQLGLIESQFIREHLGPILPDISHVFLGLVSSGLVGMITGIVTNTTFWELRRQRRHNDIPPRNRLSSR